VNEGAKGFAGSISVFCGQITLCWTWLWLMARNEKKNARER
jgi:hypothetical protein